MPGLLGTAGPQSKAEIDKLVHDMARALQDQDWYQVDLYADQGIGMGRVGLGLVDPAAQPVWNEDRTRCIVMYGEVFGIEEEKRRLIEKGFRFDRDDDAEFVLHLWQEYGEGAALRLNGTFVAALWDVQKRELILINDRLGQRPLYYAAWGEQLIFASGVRALLASPDLSRDLDWLGVGQFLAFDYLLGDRTLLQDVHLLPPASLLTFRQGQLAIRSYWSLEFVDGCPPRSQEYYVEGLVHHLRQAMRRQSKGDLVSGVSLTGGLDSRTIVAYLSEDPSALPLHTFSYGIPGCDDARLAKELSSLVGAEHHFFELRPGFVAEVAEQGVWLTDGMKSLRHMHPLATLSEQAEHVSLLHIGFLGDALIGHHIDRELWASYTDDDFAHLVFGQINTLFRPSDQEALLTEDARRTETSVFDSFCSALFESQAKLIADRQNRFDLIQRQRRLITKGHELVRSQLAVRTPFADNDLVEFMLTVPPGYRLERALTIDALSTTFPELAKVPYEGTGLPLVACSRDLRIRFSRQLSWRLRAAGLQWVPVPTPKPYADYAGWMRTSLRPWIEDTLLSDRALGRGYYNPDFVRALVGDHMAGANHAARLGVLLSLELWFRRAMD